jgi:hypothetical protein
MAGVDTARKYFSLSETIYKAYAALEAQVNKEYGRKIKLAEAARDAILNDPNSTGIEIDAAKAAFAAIKKDLDEWWGKELDGPRNASLEAQRLLQEEARETRARVDRLILFDQKLWKEARKTPA